MDVLAADFDDREADFEDDEGNFDVDADDDDLVFSLGADFDPDVDDDFRDDLVGADDEDEDPERPFLRLGEAEDDWPRSVPDAGVDDVSDLDPSLSRSRRLNFGWAGIVNGVSVTPATSFE